MPTNSDASASLTVAVICAACGADDEIMAPADDGIEVRWVCAGCGAANVEAGHPGELGEGALNPAASALTDEELAEAAQRRGVVRTLEVGGTAGPEGSTKL